MDRWFSKEITAYAMRSAGLAVANKGILDVSAVAEELRLKHAHQNIAREDIEGLVVQCGAALGAPMEISTFDDIGCSELVGLPPEPAPRNPSRVSRPDGVPPSDLGRQLNRCIEA